MAIIRIEIDGGPSEVEAHLIGLLQELRVDTSNDSLRLHDGVKEGGYEFLNRDANELLFQQRSEELDGFTFGAQEKGILVRTAPGIYRIRKVTANTGQFQVDNPRGTAADFYFELLETITTDHNWTGIHHFTQTLYGDGGFEGDLVGNVTGNLTGNAAGDHTGSFTGDLDTRGHEIQMDPGQIKEEWLDPSILTNRGVPMGAIVMWSGSVADIPTSWALCDGLNGTPDLTNRFIVGAGDTFDPNDVGGSFNGDGTVTVTTDAGGQHSHTVTVAPHALTVDEMPAHTHGLKYGSSGSSTYSADADNGNSITQTESSGGGEPHTHAGSEANADEASAHTHDITLDGSLVTPPYYALCFIMKTV